MTHGSDSANACNVAVTSDVAYARGRHGGAMSGSSSALIASHAGPCSPRLPKATATPTPNQAPPSHGRRRATANPYSAVATPTATPSSPDNACARSQKPSVPISTSIGTQRNAGPENSRPASAANVSISARSKPAPRRAALYGSSGGDSALIPIAPSAGSSGGRSTNGSPARLGTTTSPRSAMSNAMPKFVASSNFHGSWPTSPRTIHAAARNS